VPKGKREDATRAIEAAAAAFPEWSESPPSLRRKLFLKAADIFEKRQDELVRIVAEETGSTIGIAMFQMFFVPGLFREAAAQAYSVTGEVIPADYPGAFFMALRQPAGVVGAFGPFNVPYILSSRAFALPLAYGNTAVLKPSEEAPVSGGLLLAEIFEEAGFPPGVLNVITHTKADAAEVGDELIAHPAVRRISFTGSTEVGRIVAEKAGRHLKRAVMELGGKDPLIILRDADVDFAADAASWGAFLHQGQICMSTERVIVERPIADEFIEKLAQRAGALKVGDPRDPSVAIGPLINQAALDKVDGQVKEAVNGGAELVAGGETRRAGVSSDHRDGRQIRHAPLHGPDVWSRCPDRGRGGCGRSPAGGEQFQVRVVVGHHHQRLQPGLDDGAQARNRYGPYRRPDHQR
jgi:aldehyde dehydrogenase (NAD+)